ncbi:MAG: hypothetical protein KKD99_04505 [Proteobacteria bacterium]|nr:hypothetical protein [Pseudomonadota bacterium]MBU4447830.1 hypothetical protein [Pseudomonadota bacterium]
MKKPKNQLFTQKEVNKIFNHIPVKTLRWWGMKGLYGWVNETSDGRGIHRGFELGNLYQIGIVEELSSLNIHTMDLQVFMNQHFHSGLGMGLPTYMIPSQLKSDEWPSVNVVDQMDKILALVKHHGGFWHRGGPDLKKTKLVTGWMSFLLLREETTVTGFGEDISRSFKFPGEAAAIAGFDEENIVTMIFIDLQVIKKNVDSWIDYS